MNDHGQNENGAQTELFISDDGQVQLDLKLEQETLWLTQAQMSQLFDATTDNVGLHLKSVFSDGELAESATTEDFAVVRQEGKRQVRRQLKHYFVANGFGNGVSHGCSGPRGKATSEIIVSLYLGKAF